MATITIKFLAGIRNVRDQSVVRIKVSNSAKIKDLSHHLCQLGVDVDSKDLMVVLNGRGLRQWPPDRKVQSGDKLIVFPNISGG